MADVVKDWEAATAKEVEIIGTIWCQKASVMRGIVIGTVGKGYDMDVLILGRLIPLSDLRATWTQEK